MKIEYVGHACLLIDTGKIKIATDPWFDGPAYCGQWHIFPKPVNTAALNQTDVIALSHGHEDHLHAPSLEQIKGDKRVFYPYLWFGGTKEYLQSMGFGKVTEAVTYKSYRVDGETTITYLINGLDSVIVIESRNKVLVNINDALHSSSVDTINLFTDAIRGRWPQIDYLFCGFGGASYFPNCFHVPGKDDLAIGRLREQLFAHNFCRIVSGLKPKIAAPFAADFALLSPAQRWINDIRFPRSLMKQYY
ncbi:MAG: MBL fold metallo-hydrolase, partial [Blastocatellia bacterium]